jgi:hypothetical protein
MGRTFIRQDAQIAESFTYDDTVTPSLANYETNPANIEDNLNHLRSAVQNILNRSGASFPSGNWYDDMTAPTTLETGIKRGVDKINADLHAVEKKRVLRDVTNVGTDITVTAAQNWEILGAGELPAQTTAAVGNVTTLGTVVAYDSVFTGNTLDEVAGPHALNPKNLMEIVDASTGDPILSSGRRIWGLLQSESNTDGHTITATTPTRVKISFVRPNATFDDLEACPIADIATKSIQYTSRERVRLEDLTESDFLRGAIVDVGQGAGTIDRQTAYNNQGTTPVDVVTNSYLDLEGPGLEWQIRDDLEAILFRVIEGSAGGTSKVAVEDDVDEFDVDAVVSDFLNGVKVDTGAAGTTINIGVTANQIDSGGALAVVTGGSGDLTLDSVGGEILFDDVNRTGSTWAATHIKLSETTQEWDDFETEFGEVSLMNAIVQASTKAARAKGYATLQNDVAADTDVDSTTSGNLDVDLPDYSGVGTFVDDVDVYLNGELLRNGADAAANHDVYPGTTPAQGMLKFEFALKGTGGKPDQLCMIVWGS